MEEKQKAEETIKWMKLFEIMLEDADAHSFSQNTLYNRLRGDIDVMVQQCNEIIER